MNRLNAILLALVVFCAWSVVTSQYVARKLYGDMQKEQKAAKQLAVEYGQLQLEQSTGGACGDRKSRLQSLGHACA
ncbi:cell division protein FtsL [Paludibacterium denitrificans]|uniref:cell division protein FtsL n=1 Tax=Paludibacterium denitrificans TaxID=2675226 RepID=UPI001E5122F7|nr:cell division protein FtsL [Paludibacterium denitrificans]